ncbi:hypothetical protein BU17DRAFT_72349 [Hysterangium stoloniferum]|nr:hypothetical protein BU17DRAFT_72712 [Hysterangium stoloniferum]KAF8498305.1 hypothetical protein BU17DRAFT_72349 [Hysterangium stoloniferum]
MYTAAAADSESDANTFNSKSESAPAPNHQVDTSSGSNMNVSIAFNTSNNNVPFNTVLISPPFGGEGALGSGGGDFMFAAAAKAAGSWSNGMSCMRLAPFLGCLLGCIVSNAYPHTAVFPSQFQFQPCTGYLHTGFINDVEFQLFYYLSGVFVSDALGGGDGGGGADPTTVTVAALSPQLQSQRQPQHKLHAQSQSQPHFQRQWPKLLLRNTLRRRSRVKRGNMVKVNINIINPQALPVSGVLRLLHHQGRVQGEWAHVQTQFQTWTQGQAQVHSKKQF